MSLRQHFVRRKLAQKTNLSTLIEGRAALWGAGKPKKGAETRVSVCHLIVKDGQK